MVIPLYDYGSYSKLKKKRHRRCKSCNKSKPFFEFTGLNKICNKCSSNEVDLNLVDCVKCKQFKTKSEFNIGHSVCKSCEKQQINNERSTNPILDLYEIAVTEKDKERMLKYNKKVKEEVKNGERISYWKTLSGKESNRRKWNKRYRNMGLIPINKLKDGLQGHHLHLENNHDFVIYIPEWLHSFIKHDSRWDYKMITINAISIDYWINEELYINNIFL